MQTTAHCSAIHSYALAIIVTGRVADGYVALGALPSGFTLTHVIEALAMTAAVVHADEVRAIWPAERSGASALRLALVGTSLGDCAFTAKIAEI